MQHFPSNGAQLQAAMNVAQPNDEILLKPGVRYVGEFKAPARAASGDTFPIIIRTNTVLPERRITPDDATALAIIGSGVAAPAITFWGAKGWTVMGVQLEPSTNGHGEVVSIENSEYIWLDRILLVATEEFGQRRGILGNGRHIRLTRSHIAGCWDRNLQDSQAFCAWDGAGPYTIRDNFLEAAGENVMFGGADSSSAANVPADILVEGNLFTKRLSWKGQKRGVKNLLELKCAKRVVIRRNTFENNWADAQSGRSIVITPRNQDGKAPWSAVEDVLFELNLLRGVPHGLSLTGYDNNKPSGQTRRITIRDNEIEVTASAGILMMNEIGELSIYRNRITVPVDRAVVSITNEGNVWPAGEALRAAKFAVEKLVYAENTAPNGYIHSPTAIGLKAFSVYALSHSLTVPVEQPPVEEPTDPKSPTLEQRFALLETAIGVTRDRLQQVEGTMGARIQGLESELAAARQRESALKSLLAGWLTT